MRTILKYDDAEWEKLKKIFPDKCKKLDDDREIWFNGLKDEIENGGDIAEIKMREIKNSIDRFDNYFNRKTLDK